MAVFTNINAALNTKLNTLSPKPTIVWPNTKEPANLNTTYIRPTLLPSTTILHELDGRQKHQGVYQIDVFVQLQKGISELNTQLDNIFTLFKNATLVAGSDTIFVQAIGQGLARREEAWFHGMIEINYICYS